MRRLASALVALWERVRTERSTPREVGWSVAIGVFSGCTPFVGFHLWIALALATVFKLNRLWAIVGSRVSITPVFALLAFVEIEGAHRVRTGSWVPLSVHEALARGRELFADWLLGAAALGVTLAAVVGAIVYAGACARARSSAATVRKPGEAPPPTSESRRSSPLLPSR